MLNFKEIVFKINENFNQKSRGRAKLVTNSKSKGTKIVSQHCHSAKTFFEKKESKFEILTTFFSPVRPSFKDPPFYSANML